MSDDISPELERVRARWKYRGDNRPDFADEPGEDQESVWDYPRPPALAPESRRVQVLVGDTLIAETRSAIRVLETASPPTFYIPPTDVRTEFLSVGSARASFCEWKGEAHYWSVNVGHHELENASWSYPAPLSGYETIEDYFSFYPARLTCIVGDERAHPQPAGFYGGWVTSDVAGPFKGAAGTEWW